MTLVNSFIYYKYRGSKFDKPYLFVLISYNISYLVRLPSAIIELAGRKYDSDDNIYNAITYYVSNSGKIAIFAFLILFANEMHRVKDLLLADNPKKHQKKVKKFRLIK